MNLEDDILIENFLRNELSDEEEQLFLERVKTDSAFKEHYLLEKQLFESLNEEDWSFAKSIDTNEVEEYEAIFESDEMQHLKEVIKKASNSPKNNRGRVISLISGFAAAVLIGFFLIKPIFAPLIVDANGLYTTYIDLNNLPSFAERGTDDSTDQLTKAENLFKEKNYVASAEAFDEFLKNDKSVSGAYIYAAIAQSELGNYTKGIEILQNLKSSDLIDSEKAHWYKALIYVKSNQIEKAKKELKFITKKSLFNHLKAKELLSELS